MPGLLGTVGVRGQHVVRPEQRPAAAAGLDFFRQNCGLQHPYACSGQKALLGREMAEMQGAAEEVEAALARTSLLEVSLCVPSSNREIQQ